MKNVLNLIYKKNNYKRKNRKINKHKFMIKHIYLVKYMINNCKIIVMVKK